MTDYSQGCAYIDGEYVPVAEARIPILDWGFLHSDATYDVAHVWEGKFFRLTDHIERFQHSMTALRMSVPNDAAEIEAIMTECVRLSRLTAAYVEIACTRGLPEPGSRDPRTCTNRFFAFAIPFVWIADPNKQEGGLNLKISQHQRIPPESVNPIIKNYHWMDMVMAQFDAYDAGCENVVMVNAGGNLVEGPGFNIFTVKDETLSTPIKGALEGITRKTAIQLAEEEGYQVARCEIPAAAACEADEVFLTSTAGGIIPVTRLDGCLVGDGNPGSITLQLKDRYWMLHENPAYTTPIEY